MATRFIVQGTRADTGEAQQLLIEAEDVFEAGQIAGLHGFHVSSVVPEATPSGAAQYARTAPIRPKRRSGSGVMKSVFAFVVACVLCGAGIWFLISRGIVRVDLASVGLSQSGIFKAASSATQTASIQTTVHDYDIVDKLGEVLATTKGMPVVKDDGELHSDKELGDALTRSMDCFAGNTFALGGRKITVSIRGAYKDGISLTMNFRFPDVRQIGDYAVRVDTVSANMKPSQTAQAAALAVGAEAEVSGRIKFISVSAFTDGVIDAWVVVDDGEFR